MPKAAVAGGEIHYEEAGSGHPLIFASGLNGVGQSWQPQIAAFSAHYRVITYDQRGTGASDRLQRVFSIDGMAEDVTGLMDALGIERAHLIGMSTGGAIGQTLAVVHPERLARMILCSTWTHCDPWFRRLFEARRMLYQQCGPELHGRFHPLWLYPPDWVNEHDEEIETDQMRALAGAPPAEISVARIDALLAFDRRADLGRIRTPTLILATDNDYITPSYYSEALARAIPGARLHVMHGGGHSFTKTRSEAFNRMALEFLREES